MTANDYAVEITPTLRQQGHDALLALRLAAQKWDAFVLAATGDPDEGASVGLVADAIFEADTDLTRFTEAVT